MITISLFVLMFAAMFGIIRIGMKLAWGTTKLIFGLGLFWLCPALFILVVLLGWFSRLWLPILIIGLLLGRGYRNF